MGYTFDSDQLPELPDPGPRDGRHGVDRDHEFDPFPARRTSGSEPATLRVSVEDAARHLHRLLKRVEAGEEILLTRAGHPVARLTSPEPAGAFIVSETIVAVVAVDDDSLAHDEEPVARQKPRRAVPHRDDSHQLPALPDPGPRDGRHGVDSDRGYPFGG